jgi:hypothetical protein
VGGRVDDLGARGPVPSSGPANPAIDYKFRGEADFCWPWPCQDIGLVPLFSPCIPKFHDYCCWPMARIA